MKLVMNVSSRNENDDGGCVLACIDLTPQLAELALQRIESLLKLQSQDPDADEIYYWNYDAVFFDPLLGASHGREADDPLAAAGDRLLDRLDKEQKDLVEVDPLFVVPEYQLASIECGQMIARKDGSPLSPFRNTVASTLRQRTTLVRDTVERLDRIALHQASPFCLLAQTP